MEKKIYNMKNTLAIIFITGLFAVPLSAEPIPLPSESDLINHDDNRHTQQKTRVRRQYYVCPPDFERISSNCYYFSRHMATWQNAHYECRDRHSELATLLTSAEDKKLRGQLSKTVRPEEWWIDGIYDWEQMKWKWGASGNELYYQGFSRMGRENKEKLKWHCIILDPRMKYKWSARSCVLGRHFICQKKVMRVGKRGLEKLRRKYNNTLNEIEAPFIPDVKPRKSHKQETLANGGGHPVHPSLKHYRLNSDGGGNVHPNYRALNLNNAYGHRRNNTEIQRGRKNRKNHDGQRKNKNRKNRKNRKNNNKGIDLYVRNGTDFSPVISAENGYPSDYLHNKRNRKRNRRFKSKESKENNSLENGTLTPKDLNKIKKKVWNNDNNSIEDMTQKTTFMTNTLSPLHPKVIVEEHDFLDLLNNK